MASALRLMHRSSAALLFAIACFCFPDPGACQSGLFADITASSGIHFKHMASHTARKYLIETMGAGVALFDFDNDGRLDIYFVNGAPIADPQPRGDAPQKNGPDSWNRLFHQKSDGSFEDVTAKAGLQGSGYG